MNLVVNQVEEEKEQLTKALKEGDEHAFRQIFDRYFPKMVSRANAILKDEQLAKDAAQNVFVGLWNNRQRLEIQTVLEAYLMRATVNKSLSLIKSRKLHGGSSDLVEDQRLTGEDVHLELEADEMRTKIHKAIDLLPERCRLIFVLARIDGLSHKAIAKKLQISTKTIENQMTRALKLLRSTIYPILIFILFMNI